MTSLLLPPAPSGGNSNSQESSPTSYDQQQPLPVSSYYFAQPQESSHSWSGVSPPRSPASTIHEGSGHGHSGLAPAYYTVDMSGSVSVLYDSIVYYANDARNSFIQGAEGEALERLEQISRTIEVLKDYRRRNAELAQESLPRAVPQHTPVPEAPIDASNARKRAHTSTLERPSKARRSSEMATPSMPTDSPPSPTGQHNDDEASGGALLLPGWIIDPDLCQRLDEVFFAFLAKVCSDLECQDASGEKIHQTLTARKVSKPSDHPEFFAFKFRIRSFTNAFKDELKLAGFSDELIHDRKIKQYLWQQRYISRFNEDGKKAKSKGSHVWVVEARKTADGGWIFKEFERKITGCDPSPIAYVGIRYVYEPKVYDPQIKITPAARQGPKVVFHSPWLPNWLGWENNVLVGVPPPDAKNCFLTVIASYFHGETSYRLERNFHLTVTKYPTAVHDGHEDDTQLGPRYQYPSHARGGMVMTQPFH
ncbi:hypothetical protein HK104_004899 [Borealophlyctis nickersoniae]|nr:hypothetical protein HK104_004899 [Borealophlyctis nickersoniae]